MMKHWNGFTEGRWQSEVDVRDFIVTNYTPYEGNEKFLEKPTHETTALWDQVMELSKQERDNGGVLDMDTKVVSAITSHGPGYLQKELEQIVGFQTDQPFKRSLQPFGGIRMAAAACESYGFTLDEEVEEVFTKYRKTHNQGVFDAYTPEMKLARRAGIITGLPDAYGRGRIIGDYRRVALYGVDFLIKEKKKELDLLGNGTMSEEVIRDREETAEQIRALHELKELASSIRIRHFYSCYKRKGSFPMAVFRLSCCHQGTKWRCNEPWKSVYVPGYIYD